MKVSNSQGKVSPRFQKHKEAPMYSGTERENRLILRQVISEATSGNLSSAEEVRQVFRQTGFVSLHFFLKHIAGYNGPYDELNEDLHLSMCNFRQSLVEKGCRGAGFLPRSHYKSTIFTTGGMAWELLRSSELTIGLFNAVYDNALEFMHTVQRIFDSNEFFKWLYPEKVPDKMQKRWNDVELVMPDRKRHKNEPNLRCGSVGGASEGKHYELLVLDDIIGLKQLNANRQSNAEMYRTVNWFKSIEKTLLHNWKTSRIVLVGTRYSIDDVYEPIMQNMKSLEGFAKNMPYEIKEDGKWKVYYRQVREDEKIIFPENITEELLSDLQKDDPWTYTTQYLNNPIESGLTELNEYTVVPFELTYDEKRSDWVISYREEGEFSQEKKVYLSDCDVIQAGDPAATEKYISAKTSRSAVGVVAHAPDDKRFLLTLNADYVPISRVFDWFFINMKKFRGFIRGTILEAQGAFRMLGGILRDEERRRMEESTRKNEEVIYLNMKTVTKTGEKDATIRSTLEPILKKKLLFCEKNIMNKLMEELNTFPQSTKKDVLDMLSLGLRATIRPMTESEKVSKNRREWNFRNRTANVAGY